MGVQQVRGTSARSVGGPVARPGEERIAIGFREPGDRLGSTPVPNAVLEDARLDPVARLAYALVLRLAAAPGGELTLASLGGSLGQSPAQALDALRALLEAGLLSISERRADGQPSALALEPLSRRYGQDGAAASPAGAAPGSRLRDLSSVRAVAEPRGAVIPLMTEQRRAFEDRLAARIPTQPPMRVLDPAVRAIGMTQARRLRSQLRPGP